ncbi:HNH endonuclease signature motif containing protein [Sinomicrobium sp.]
MDNTHITQERLIELFEYKEGRLFWRTTGTGRRKDRKAGYYNKNGYRGIMVEGKRYYEHRLIYLYHYGYLPKVVDHINHIVDDNRIENLRGATHSKNGFNSTSRGGSSRHKGISYIKKQKTWRARYSVNGVEYSIGCFKTEEEALNAYNEVVPQIHGEFFNKNSSLDY